jgi:adenine-specific DNA-methyltransferase
MWSAIMEEKKEYLKKQIITYLGNKRTLIDYIEIEIKLIQEKLKCDKTVNLDLFSGSGIVARMMKKYSSKIIANDLEDYSFLINSCYLENESSFDKVSFDKIHKKIMSSIKTTPFEGFITELYAPKNSKKIKRNERVFFTRENAIIIDSMLHYVKKNVPSEMRKFFIAPLLSEASIKNNTAGVFKGFYKDKNTGIGRFGGTGEYSLSRILAPIEVNEPIFSAFDSKFEVYKEDANELVKKLKGIDITYIDPPYNQHPYGSNYFMLNLIARNTAPSDISKISGIPND